MPEFRIWYLFPVIIVPFLLMVFDAQWPRRHEAGSKDQIGTKPAKPAADPYEEAQKEADRFMAEHEAKTRPRAGRDDTGGTGIPRPDRRRESGGVGGRDK